VGQQGREKSLIRFDTIPVCDGHASDAMTAIAVRCRASRGKKLSVVLYSFQHRLYTLPDPRRPVRPWPLPVCRWNLSPAGKEFCMSWWGVEQFILHNMLIYMGDY